MRNRAAVLLTGFEAFGDSDINPTADIVDLLDGAEVLGRRVIGLELPVSVGRMPGLLLRAVDAYVPDLVLRGYPSQCTDLGGAGAVAQCR